ncbi:retrovirus-related pol polyprotein from transposon TNT 1-94 [Tanacetum coccineum]
MLLVQDLESMAVLDEEHMEFLADNGDTVTTSATGQDSQELTLPTIFQTDDLDAFDSDCDEAPSASAVLMAKLSAYDSDVLLEVPNLVNYQTNNMIDQSVQEMQYSEQPPFINDSDTNITSDSNVISYDQYLEETENEVNKENKTVNESLTAELERYKEQIKKIEKRQKFKQGLAKEITDMREVFNQMETKVAKCSVDKKYFEIENKESFIENDHLLEHIICQDVMCIAMYADLDNKCVVPANDNHLEYAEMEQSYINEYSKVSELEVELSKKKDMVEKDVYNELSKRSSRLEQHCINLEIRVQQMKEKQARAQQPLDSALEYARKFTTRIQELLVYVSATCPRSLHVNEKLVTITPMNKSKKVSNHGLWGLSDRKCHDFLGLLCGTQLIYSRSFCDSDLEVAFRKHTYFVHDLEGVDLLKGSRGINLYTMSLEEMMQSSPICLLSKASKTKFWLWHRRLSHLNFGTINALVKQGLVRGLPKLKYQKDHLCSACSLGKSKKHTSVGVFDEVFLIWKAFGRITRDLGSFGEETDKTTDLHQHCLRISLQWLETASQIQCDSVTTKIKTASQDSTTASEHTTQPII